LKLEMKRGGKDRDAVGVTNERRKGVFAAQQYT
jgi:hypothetical protein